MPAIGMLQQQQNHLGNKPNPPSNVNANIALVWTAMTYIFFSLVLLLLLLFALAVSVAVVVEAVVVIVSTWANRPLHHIKCNLKQQFIHALLTCLARQKTKFFIICAGFSFLFSIRFHLFSMRMHSACVIWMSASQSNPNPTYIHYINNEFCDMTKRCLNAKYTRALPRFFSFFLSHFRNRFNSATITVTVTVIITIAIANNANIANIIH